MKNYEVIYIKGFRWEPHSTSERSITVRLSSQTLAESIATGFAYQTEKAKTILTPM